MTVLGACVVILILGIILLAIFDKREPLTYHDIIRIYDLDNHDFDDHEKRSFYNIYLAYYYDRQEDDFDGMTHIELMKFKRREKEEKIEERAKTSIV